jgi:O-acetyl-ADP-ribose deacetylase (regulator of RNase III)
MHNKIVHRKGDVITALEEGEIDLLLHVTNCQGVMGSGIAKSIKERVPSAFTSYKNSPMRLGRLSDSKGVINMNAQDRYGVDKRHLHYGALASCLRTVREDWKDASKLYRIGVPYKMGSDRAGGDWEIVKEMIEFYLFPDFEVFVYQL